MLLHAGQNTYENGTFKSRCVLMTRLHVHMIVTVPEMFWPKKLYSIVSYETLLILIRVG